MTTSISKYVIPKATKATEEKTQKVTQTHAFQSVTFCTHNIF